MAFVVWKDIIKQRAFPHFAAVEGTPGLLPGQDKREVGVKRTESAGIKRGLCPGRSPRTEPGRPSSDRRRAAEKRRPDTDAWGSQGKNQSPGHSTGTPAGGPTPPGLRGRRLAFKCFILKYEWTDQDQQTIENSLLHKRQRPQ